MSPEAIRIACAECNGWVWYRIPNPGHHDKEHRLLAHPSIQEYPDQSPKWTVRADGTERQCNWEYMEREGHVPRYDTDTNASLELLSTLPPDEWFIQCHRQAKNQWFVIAINKRECHSITATSPTFPLAVAEVFLKINNRWKDESK